MVTIYDYGDIDHPTVLAHVRLRPDGTVEISADCPPNLRIELERGVPAAGRRNVFPSEGQIFLDAVWKQYQGSYCRAMKEPDQPRLWT